ncbi:MAG: glucose 1-dehydrogenase [Acidobacteria bacterium]|nr:glucose 1-dehydrogenase [Acidobacteriota bacterium]
MDRLKGKVAIVTGGVNGIGRAISELFAAEGAYVLVADIEDEGGRTSADLARAEGWKLEFVRTDVTRVEDVKHCVDRAAAFNGRIDILCNNAAYLSADFHGALDATEEEWRRCIDVALLGTHACTQAVLPYMVEQRQGSIINVASIQAMQGMMTSAAYTATKAALLGYTMSLSYDYGPDNVRANALCPGAIQTRISAAADSPHAQWQREQTTLGRVGVPQEVAWAALFLASDESSYVTGIALPVDGGWTSSASRKRA